MKKILISALCLALTLPASAQALIQHPWQGKRVAYLGDSITDPRNKASQKERCNQTGKPVERGTRRQCGCHFHLHGNERLEQWRSPGTMVSGNLRQCRICPRRLCETLGKTAPPHTEFRR